MVDIGLALKRAVTDGVISAEQAGRLEDAYFVSPPAPAGADVADGEVVDTEVPRFIRGFHDVLITVGLVIFLSALSGLGSIFAVLPGIVVLAEILVRRQRLALPAVALTIALVVWAITSGVVLADEYGRSWSDLAKIAAVLTPLALGTGLFYWRYRIPVSLAAFFTSLAAFALLLVFEILGRIAGTDNFFTTHKAVSATILFVAALAFFALAMKFDLSDPERRTRRSDIAFWLHLVTAPALLYSILAFVFMQGENSLFSLDADHVYRGAGQVVAAVTVLMLLGIIIDRRAFVTSGLLSLIAAVIAVLSQGKTDGGSATFVGLLLVGMIVLTIGIGWPKLRGFVVGFLPSDIQARLPPVRIGAATAD